MTETQPTESKEIQKSEAKVESAPKEVEKSTQPSSLDRVVGLVETLAKSLEDQAKSTNERITAMEKAISQVKKPVEQPTDFKLEPKKEPEDNDIGDRVLAPDVYQSYSRQAGIDQASPDPSLTDTPDKRMEDDQEKVVKGRNVSKTTTPRAATFVEQVYKSRGLEMNPILKDAREMGFKEAFEGGEIGRRIKSGFYHKEGSIFPELAGGRT